jgi:hypothetical protein
MKKSTFISTIAFAFLMLLSFNANAQEFKDLDKSPLDAASYPSNYKDANKIIKVIYSRPQLNERPLSKLAPNGKVWRTGANESVEITFYKDVKFGRDVVKAGTYSLFTIPGEKEWTILLNSDLNTWGAYFYDEANNIAKATVPVTEGKESLEAFSIAFDKKGTMHLGWDKVRVAVPFEMR